MSPSRPTDVRPQPRSPLAIDIGGEGRYPWLWNVNPSRTRTLGPLAGRPIPQLIVARADALPFASASVDVALIERSPLPRAALEELRRVVVPGGWIILRHVPLPERDRHALALATIPGSYHRRTFLLDGMPVQETIIRPRGRSGHQLAFRRRLPDPTVMHRLLATLGVDRALLPPEMPHPQR